MPRRSMSKKYGLKSKTLNKKYPRSLTKWAEIRKSSRSTLTVLAWSNPCSCWCCCSLNHNYNTGGVRLTLAVRLPFDYHLFNYVCYSHHLDRLFRSDRVRYRKGALFKDWPACRRRQERGIIRQEGYHTFGWILICLPAWDYRYRTRSRVDWGTNLWGYP